MHLKTIFVLQRFRLAMRTGYPRTLSNKGWVLIHGQKAPILGRVCMDQFMVDVTDIPDVKHGDEVTLIAKTETNLSALRLLAICQADFLMNLPAISANVSRESI